MKGKCKSARLSLISAAVNLVTLTVFLIYGAVYDYLDYMVALTMALGAACAVGYGLVDKAVTAFLNLLQVILMSYSVGLFFLNSHPVWADRLNDIDMYGARGSLVPVVIIMVLCVVTVGLGIASCFTGKEEK